MYCLNEEAKESLGAILVGIVKIFTGIAIYIVMMGAILMFVDPIPFTIGNTIVYYVGWSLNLIAISLGIQKLGKWFIDNMEKC